MKPRAGQILISMIIVLAGLSSVFGAVYIINMYPIIGGIGASVIAIGFFTWIVWALLFAPPDPYDY